MKVKSRFGALAAVLCALVMLTTVFSAAVMVAAQTEPMIWTEWGDYCQADLPQTVNVYGDGFGSGVIIAVEVVGPNNALVYSTPSATIGANGLLCSFVLQPGSLEGLYTVTARGGGQTATVTFMDGNEFWNQAANDGLGSSKPDGMPDGTSQSPQIEWVTGNLGQSKEAVTEGNFVPTYPPNVPGHINYRMIIPTTGASSLPAGQYKWTIQYGFTKGGKMAIDFLTTSYGLKGTDALLYNDLSGPEKTAISGMVANGPTSTVSFGPDNYPAPNTLPSNLLGGYVSDRQAVHDAAFLNNVLSNPIRSLRMYGATINNIAAPVHTGAVTGDSDASVVVTFTIPTSNSGYVLATWGGHIAIGTADAGGYGVGNGATGISGSPYHMIFGGVNDMSGNSLINGGNDLSLSAETVAV